MKRLKDYTPSHSLIFCIDSDGCVFDTMEIKHKECFCPPYINHFELQAISKYAREAWEYTNLYSISRGMHRFITLEMSLELLSERAEVKERGFTVPDFSALTAWIKETPKLSNDLLAEAIRNHPDALILNQAYNWSLAVNETIGAIVRGIPPFPYARKCLEIMSQFADIVIVSATQEKALIREWTEHRLDSFANVVCGQETGSKAEIIGQLRTSHPECQVIMIGDAPGDMKAAHVNDSLFYPICPGNETASWHWLFEHMAIMENRKYNADTEAELIKAFQQHLPTVPPWNN